MAEEDDTQAMTLRLPRAMHQELRAYKLFTNKPINEVIVELIGDFLAGPGGQEIARGMTERAKKMHGGALEELGRSDA